MVKRDVYEVVSEYVSLKGPYGEHTGRPYYKGLCPLHDDHDPSFVVYVKSQRCACLACWPEGGDVIDFVRRVEGWSFHKAKKYCCEEVTPVRELHTRLKAVGKSKKASCLIESRVLDFRRWAMSPHLDRARFLEAFDAAMSGDAITLRSAFGGVE